MDRNAARYTWTAALVILALWLVYVMRSTLFIFAVALLFAYLISPLVNLLDRFLPTSRTRTPALALAYVIFVGGVVLVAIQIGSRVVEEANNLSSKFPDMLAGWEKPAESASPTVNTLKAQVVERIRNELGARSGDLLTAFTKAGLRFITVASDAIFIVIVPILSFFFLKDAAAMRNQLLELVDAGPHRELLHDLLADIHLLLLHYMRALMGLSAAAFTAYGIAFSIMGVPYAILLAALGGMLEFIPMIGPLTAGVLIVIVSAVAHSHVLGVLIFLVAYRLFQDYILSPHLMGQGVEIHPLLVLFGVFAGAEVAGIAGSFLSVPILAMVRIIYVRIRRNRLSAPFNTPVSMQ